MSGLRRSIVAAAAALLSACAAGPDYQRPAVEMPAAWQVEAPWRAGTPADHLAKGSWWQRFGDPRLDALEQQALAGSPTLVAADARLNQARAILRATSAGLLPQIALNARAARQEISADRPQSSYATANSSTVQNDLVAAFSVSYEADLSGRLRRGVEGVRASAEQSAADLENVRLLLTTDLAMAYFNLRALDTELDVVLRSIELQRRALGFVTARRDSGAASGLEVAQQQALLDSTLTQVDLLRKARAQFEHAIASLTGTPAPLFALAPQAATVAAPVIPLGVPSDVLERRPDVASAERAMAVANAQIGVASAAFYPSIVLGSQLGAESVALASLFDAPALMWSLGVSATQLLFDGGRLRANVDFARSGYDATVATYRRVVLIAMQEVEDGISGSAALARASTQADTAVTSARRVFDMASARYEAGATTYLDVITAQQGLLSSERQAAQLLGQQLVTSVFLVKALGGDWHAAKIAAD